MTSLAALLAEAVASPDAGAPPAWVTTLLGVATIVLGVLKALDAARVAQLQGALRATKNGLRVVASVLDKLDGDEDPQEIKDKVRAESTAAGTEPVLKATLAEIRGGAPKPPAGPPPGVVGALLLAVALGLSGCVGARVHETAVAAQRSNARAATLLRLYRAAVQARDPALAAAVAKAGEELSETVEEHARALAAVEEASR